MPLKLFNSKLHGLLMLVDIMPTFIGLKKTSSYWSVKRISAFLCFSLVNQRHTSGITVYIQTVTNIENTARAVHSCNSWFGLNIFISSYNYTSIQIYMMIIQAMGLERKLKAYKVLLLNMKYLHKLWRIPVYSRKIGTMLNQI